jgi:hypothetical protein
VRVLMTIGNFARGLTKNAFAVGLRVENHRIRLQNRRRERYWIIHCL